MPREARAVLTTTLTCSVWTRLGSKLELGSKLIRAVSQMADAKGVPCYLECAGKRVRDIYAHHGYEEQQCSTLSIEGDEPGFEMKEFFAMVRPAKK